MIVIILAALTLQTQSSQLAPPLSAMVPPPDASVFLAAESGLNAAEATLDRMHDAASRADGQTYFAQFTVSAQFVGTDASEHWDIGELEAYAKPHFDRGQGWTYRPRDRTTHIHADVVWFDEILDHDGYGVLRGSGVLVREGEDWKIEQYVLSFAVPNDKAEAVVDVIRSEPVD